MFQSALVWTLTTAFLVTLPVTGAGHCPCRFVKALHTPPPAPAALTPAAPPCKCCRQTHDQDGPDRSEGTRQHSSHSPGGPPDTPCDHGRVVDAAVPGSVSERSVPASGSGDWNALADAWGAAATFRAGGAVSASAVPPPAPRPGTHVLRYAHAFRI